MEWTTRSRPYKTSWSLSPRKPSHSFAGHISHNAERERISIALRDQRPYMESLLRNDICSAMETDAVTPTSSPEVTADAASRRRKSEVLSQCKSRGQFNAFNAITHCLRQYYLDPRSASPILTHQQTHSSQLWVCQEQTNRDYYLSSGGGLH